MEFKIEKYKWLSTMSIPFEIQGEYDVLFLGTQH